MWCIPKPKGEGKKHCREAENLESTWREAVCAGRNLTLCYHMVKAKFRLWMPPSKLVFLLQRPFGSKGNFTSNKKASRLCFLLACSISFPPPAFCTVSLWQKGCSWGNIPEELRGHHTSPQHLSNPLLWLQYLVLLPVCISTLKLKIWNRSRKQKPCQKHREPAWSCKISDISL